MAHIMFLCHNSNGGRLIDMQCSIDNKCSLADIGLRIAAMRSERGLSQDELAKNLNVSREVVAKWENGTRDLKTQHTVALAKCFGVSCDEILRGIKCENISINEKTGLSDNAIEVLEMYRDYYKYVSEDLTPTLSMLIEQEQFSPFEIEPSYLVSSSCPPDVADEWRRHQEEWENRNYIPILSKIEKYLNAKVNINIMYDITDDGTVEEGTRADSIQIVSAADIVEKILLSDIEQSLKKLKQKLGDTNSKPGRHPTRKKKEAADNAETQNK